MVVELCFSASIFLPGALSAKNIFVFCSAVENPDLAKIYWFVLFFLQRLLCINAPLFDVTEVLLNPTQQHIALIGSKGLMVLDVPKRWGKNSEFEGGEKIVNCRYFIFLYNWRSINCLISVTLWCLGVISQGQILLCRQKWTCGASSKSAACQFISWICLHFFFLFDSGKSKSTNFPLKCVVFLFYTLMCNPVC